MPQERTSSRPAAHLLRADTNVLVVEAGGLSSLGLVGYLAWIPTGSR